MKIRDEEYRGFKFKILFADRGDWGNSLHHFYTECDHNFSGGFSKDLDIVITTFKEEVDAFYNNIPTTVDGLVSVLEDQLVWTGYESCHLDSKTSRLLIEGFLHKYKEVNDEHDSN